MSLNKVFTAVYNVKTSSEYIDLENEAKKFVIIYHFNFIKDS